MERVEEEAQAMSAAKPGTCETCAHWKQHGTRGCGVCAHLYESALVCTVDGEGMDGGEGGVEIHVEASFGCVLHEKAE